MNKYKTWNEVKKDFNLTEKDQIEINLEVELIEKAIKEKNVNKENEL